MIYIMKTNKKFIGFLLFGMVAAIIFSALSVLPVSASKMQDGDNYSWYFKPADSNEQPTFDLDLAELAEYDTYAMGGKDDKVIYLTFDFGYENGNVKKCLDVLNKNDVKGAFFILDHIVDKHADLLKEMIDTGHIVANHTLKHKNMCQIKDFEDYKKEIVGLNEKFEAATGYKMSSYYRPPKGEFTKQNLEYNKKLGCKTIFWSVAYMDWDNNNQPDPQSSIERLLKRTHNGAVVLLHPTSKTNADILDTLIQEWKMRGYRFGTLDELTGTNAGTNCVRPQI